MEELALSQVKITGGFWAPRLEVNARSALLHQWEQLEQSGCIRNFGLAAGREQGFREGWFFADSDAYKWLEAASRAYAALPLPALAERIESFVDLLVAAQAADGYLYTYNQIFFPGTRWANLQIEHELYCHGHLIEAGIAHQQATGQDRMLAVAQKAADRMVADLLGRGPEATPGHEEVEIALLKLHRLTGRDDYLALARQFLEQRGRMRPFAPHILRQTRSVARRLAEVRKQRQAYITAHPDYAEFRLPAGVAARKPAGIRRRYILSALSGKLLQQHRPIRRQREPVGHAVRFAYLETAVAMLYRHTGDETLLPALEAAWEKMVNRRMHVTGGIGSLAEIEGFGRDYELDPEMAYAETCAALGCLFWNWQMSLITAKARYADLFEWQLYNAAAGGMGLDGRSYLYNNPLASRGEMERRPWYQVPCCPSNLSRTWASLGGYLYARSPGNLWVQQYVDSQAGVDMGVPITLEVKTGLPWQGKARLRLDAPAPVSFTLHLRLPGWSSGCRLWVNGQEVPNPGADRRPDVREQPASGYSPEAAAYLPLERTWSPGDVVDLEFAMSPTVRRPHPSVRSLAGRVALTRGPLVYCLESVDNAGMDIFQARIDPDSLRPEYSAAHFGGVWLLRGQTREGETFTGIPYAYWANRGPAQMAVWLRT